MTGLTGQKATNARTHDAITNNDVMCSTFGLLFICEKKEPRRQLPIPCKNSKKICGLDAKERKSAPWMNVASLVGEYTLSKWPLIVAYVLCIAMLNAAWVAGSHFLSQVTDQLIAGQSAHMAIMLALAAWALAPVMTVINDLLDMHFMPPLASHMRGTLTRQVLHTFKRRVTTQRVGDVVSKMVKVPLMTLNLATQFREHFVSAALSVLIVAAYLFWIHPLIGSIFSAGIAGFCTVLWLVMRPTLARASQLDHESDMVTERAADILANMQNVYASGMVLSESIALDKNQTDLEALHRRVIRMVLLSRGVFNVWYLLMFAAILFASIWLFRRGRLTPGMLTSTGFVIGYAVYVMDDTSHEMVSFVTSIGSLSKIQRYLNSLAQTADENPDGSDTVAPRDGAIELRDLTVRYSPDGPAVLDNLTLSIKAGERVVLQGTNGSGKSTLLNVISGNLPYEQGGSVTLGGVEVRRTQASVLRKSIIHIPQTPQLFDRTVYENIAYGTDASRNDVQDLLDRFEITFAGLDTPVGKGGTNLSGGQRQIIYLLRAFLRADAQFLLLDEPTAAFDPSTRDKAMRLLEGIMENRTTLLITHDRDLVVYADRVLDFSPTTKS